MVIGCLARDGDCLVRDEAYSNVCSVEDGPFSTGDGTCLTEDEASSTIGCWLVSLDGTAFGKVCVCDNLLEIYR